MPTVTSLFPRKVAGVLHQSVDSAALLRALGLDPEAPADPSHMISAEEYYDFLERAAQADPDGATVSLRAGASMRPGDYGVFGLAWKSAATLRGSYDRLERHALVLSRVSTYEVEETPDGAYMHLHRSGERRLGMRLSNEATIAAIAVMSEQVVTSIFQPTAVYFKHRAPARTDAHEEHFGCPVYFDTDRDALFVSTASLQAPNLVGDESIASFFDTYLADELSKYGEAPLERNVRDHVSQALSEGIPGVSDVAGALGMSARTLQRRLADEGHTFQDLVDEAQRQLARRLLTTTNTSLAEVAFMTGFSGQSAFSRAFKRWSGQTPRSYRVQARGSG